jgi:RHH-type proline utilization regulon transcriptional repressor/proline dehydrogenase/delta 1-pyrroline-5-carboxylate dehydrogenase
VALANRTGYGLTAGLESLDSREIDWWKGHLMAGNLYIGRPTTGAVVLRQPFGGMGKSALGAGIKAGGPNYVSQFMDFTDAGPPMAGPIRREHRLLRLCLEWEEKLRWDRWPDRDARQIRKITRAFRSYLHRFETEFADETDFSHIRGQDNLFRYLPIGRIIIRVHENDTLFDTLARLAAAEIAGCRPEASLPPGLETAATDFMGRPDGVRFMGTIPIHVQTDEDLSSETSREDRIRYAAPDRVPAEIYRAAAASGSYIARAPVLMEGRMELLHYLREQSISHSYHRYGNLGDRENRS